MIFPLQEHHQANLFILQFLSQIVNSCNANSFSFPATENSIKYVGRLMFYSKTNLLHRDLEIFLSLTTSTFYFNVLMGNSLFT